jgi:hypothetical protein
MPSIKYFVSVCYHLFMQKVQYLRSYQNVKFDVHSIYGLHTYKVNFTPQQVTNVLRWSSGIALLFLQPRHWMWLFYPRERPGTHCTGGWVGLRTGLDRCGKSRPTGIRSPDRPARRQSLYRLRYPAHTVHCNLVQIRTRQAMHVQRNNEARSRNHCCRCQAINITCSERL